MSEIDSLLKIAATNEFLIVQLLPGVDKAPDVIEQMWLFDGHLNFVDADDDKRQMRFQITQKGLAAYRGGRGALE